MGGFPKRRRLRKRREFLQIQGAGRRVHAASFVVVVHDGSGRVGITVSKKVGNAVTRNRVKRMVREFVRLHDWVPATKDVVVIARVRARNLAGLSDVTRELSALGAKVRAC